MGGKDTGIGPEQANAAQPGRGKQQAASTLQVKAAQDTAADKDLQMPEKITNGADEIAEKSNEAKACNSSSNSGGWQEEKSSIAHSIHWCRLCCEFLITLTHVHNYILCEFWWPQGKLRQQESLECSQEVWALEAYCPWLSAAVFSMRVIRHHEKDSNMCTRWPMLDILMLKWCACRACKSILALRL